MSIRKLILDTAAKHNLPPSLLNELVRQESSFNPKAKSPAGATGLTQLMPATARSLGVKNPLDPAENLDAGARYLKQQLDTFGDVGKALAAYNAGPGAVQKHGGIPPYKETQNYVDVITKRLGTTSYTQPVTQPSKVNRLELFNQQYSKPYVPPKTKPKPYTETRPIWQKAIDKVVPGAQLRATLPEPQRPTSTALPPYRPTVTGVVNDPLGGSRYMPPQAQSVFETKPSIPVLRPGAEPPKHWTPGQKANAVAVGFFESLGVLNPEYLRTHPTVGEAVRGYPSAPPELFTNTLSPQDLLQLRVKAGIPIPQPIEELPENYRVGGGMVGALLPIAGAEATGGRIGRALARKVLPKFIESGTIPSKVVERAVSGGFTGATFGAGTAAMHGKSIEEIKRDALMNALFFGVGMPAGTAVESGIAKKVSEATLAKTPTRIATAGARGAATGAAGTAATLPLYPAGQRPSGGDVAKQAGSLALFDALASIVTGGRAAVAKRAEGKQAMLDAAAAYRQGKRQVIEPLQVLTVSEAVRSKFGPKGTPIEERSFDEVGSPKVKAYQWEHPELAPHIRTEAKRLLVELNDSVKGGRTVSRGPNDEIIVTSNARYTSEPIRRILDETGATYGEVKDALSRVIRNQGSENQALAKKIELVIDDNLSQGAKTLDGYDLGINQAYVGMKEKLQGIKKVAQPAPVSNIDFLDLLTEGNSVKLPPSETKANTPDMTVKEPWQMTKEEHEASNPHILVPDSFKQSKIKEPVYHGSGAKNIDEFFTLPEETGANTGGKTTRLGAFFSEDPDIARTASYGFSITGAFDKQRKPTLYTTRINLRNPLDINALKEEDLYKLEAEFPGIIKVHNKAKDPFEVVQYIAKSKKEGSFPELPNFYTYAKDKGLTKQEIDKAWHNRENPIFREWLDKVETNFTDSITSNGQEKLKRLGYDGIVVKTMVDSGEKIGPQKQYIVFDKKNIFISRKESAISHEIQVKAALQEGKPVPPEVLKDYPDLVSEMINGQSPTRLGKAESAMAKAVDTALPKATPPAGMSIRLVRRTPQTGTTYRFTDPKIEERWQAAKGVKEASFKEQIPERLQTMWARATREFEHLPRTGEFSGLRFALSKLQKQKDIAADRALRLQQGITAKLDKNTYDLFTRKVILDDLMQEAKAGKDLPFGFTPTTLAAEHAKVTAEVANSPDVTKAVTDRKDVWQAVKDEYGQAMKNIGFDVSNRIGKEDYYRHQVLEYANAKAVAGSGKKLKTPTGRGFLKQRQGSEHDINTDYLQAEAEVMMQMLHDTEVAKTIKLVNDQYNIQPRLANEAKAQGKTTGKKVDWHNLIPEGYTLWQPRQGSAFYMADSVPARIAEKLYANALTEIGIKGEDLRRVLAKGQRFQEFVIKEEVAKTLDNLYRERADNPVAAISRFIQQKWKTLVLAEPTRVIKYNLRNLTGDADALFAGNPSAFKKVPQAVRELYQVYAGDRAMTADMKDWFERGGMQTLLQVQELGDINKLRMFDRFQQKRTGLKDIPLNAWHGYWQKARLATDFREAILRYGAYLDYLEQMQASGGRPKNFGASIPDEVMALPEIKDRAFKLSNELLGAYDQVGVYGQGVREHLIPFWSWNEINFRRYKQLTINAANDGKLASTAGRKLVGTLLRSPFMAYKVGKFALKASALWGMVQVWNQTRFPDEERELPPDVQKRPHIVFGRDKNGKIIYFDRLGALSDFLGWFGLDTPVGDVTDFLNGRRTLKEIAVGMVKEPVNKLTGGITPLYKTPVEALTKTKLWPDIFKIRPGSIRDMPLHIAQGLGFGEEFKKLTGRPARPYDPSQYLIYKVDPDEAAYNAIIDEKYRFMNKIGKPGAAGAALTPKRMALYNLKLALKYGDRRAAEKYLGLYALYGGTEKGLQKSVATLDPLYGLKSEEKTAFINSLSGGDYDRLTQADRFYKEVLQRRQ